jgi:hypothetical protein
LPRTGLQVGFTKAYIVRPGGGTESSGIVPIIAIDTPLVEGPEDPVLECAAAYARLHAYEDLECPNVRK